MLFEPSADAAIPAKELSMRERWDSDTLRFELVGTAVSVRLPAHRFQAWSTKQKDASVQRRVAPLLLITDASLLTLGQGPIPLFSGYGGATRGWNGC